MRTPERTRMITHEIVERIRRFDGAGIPVTSAYVGVRGGPGTQGDVHTQLSSLFHEIRHLPDDPSLGHDVRLSIRDDMARIEAASGERRWPPGAVAFFSCGARGFLEVVTLPRTVRDRIVVDATPWIRPLVAVLDEERRSCVLVIDKASAWVWQLYQRELVEATELRDAVLRKPNYAGWYGLEEYRVSNRNDELVKRHYRRVSELIDEQFRLRRYETLVVGGHDEAVTQFVDFLPGQLLERLAGTFSVDPRSATPADIRDSAMRLVEGFEEQQEQKWVAQVLGDAAAGRLAAVGLARCLWAASVGAVKALLIHDELVAPGVACDTCGWLGTSGETCPVCQSVTRATPDVVDELAEAVIDGGGTVEHVTADTDLKEHQVAATLRFPLPPEPEPAG
jgi:peptide subunit release factor 1 (eRF1)